MGALLALIATLFQTAKDLVSKQIAFSTSGSVSAFASFVFALPFYGLLLLVLWLTGVEHFQYSALFLKYVLLRSITDVGAEWCKMSALSYSDISIAGCFFSLSPLFLLYTSPLITGDEIPHVASLAVVITVLGSVIIATGPRHTPIGSRQLKGIGLALASAFFFSLNNCFDRLAVLEASPALSGFGMTFLSGLLLAPVVLPFAASRAGLGGANMRPFVWRGALEVIFMVTKLWALVYLAAPIVSGIQRLSLVFSIVGGRVFYHEKHFGRRLLGGLVILAGVALIFWSQLYTPQAIPIPTVTGK